MPAIALPAEFHAGTAAAAAAAAPPVPVPVPVAEKASLVGASLAFDVDELCAAADDSAAVDEWPEDLADLI